MAKLIKILILVLAIVSTGLKFDSWAAGRWEKQLELTGYYSGSADNYTTRAGINGNFTRWGIVSSWVNLFMVSYDESTTEEAGKILNPETSYVKLAETYTYNLSAFTFWKLYFAVSDSLLDGDDIYSDTILTIGKTFSRYLNGSIGLKIGKMLVPDLDPVTYLRIESLYSKSLGYRTKLSIAPAIDFNTDDLSNYELAITSNLTYKFGRRISLEIGAVSKYWATTSEFDNTAKVDLVYDLFMY